MDLGREEQRGQKVWIKRKKIYTNNNNDVALSMRILISCKPLESNNQL